MKRNGFWIGILIGLAVGGCLGVMWICLLQVNHGCKEDGQKEENNEQSSL